MKSLLVAIDALEKLLEQMKSPGQSAGAFSAMMIISRDFMDEVDQESVPGSAYISGKVSSLQWHIKALIGAGPDNGHDFDSHFGWAYGDIQVLRDVILELPEQ